MDQEIIRTDAYKALIADLKQRVQSAQLRAARAVNQELLALYWDIGRTIAERQAESGWGDGVIRQIAADLTRELGGLKGFSRSNLYNMKQWYGFYVEAGENVQQLVGQIPWGHNIQIIQKVKDIDRAVWYANKSLENGWSRDVLALQIDSQLYERQAVSKTVDNFEARLPKVGSDLARQSLKDPYIFDFLDVGEEAAEREVEGALIRELQRFMLELGAGFAFVGQQYRLEVGGQEFFIDLLFYHLKLHCYVVIELKNGAFKPEYAGKLNFYLTAVDEEVKTPEDNPSIGLLLCRDRNNVVAEYALRDLNKPMGVSEYRLSEQLPEEFRKSLPSIELLEEGLRDRGNDESDGSSG